MTAAANIPLPIQPVREAALKSTMMQLQQQQIDMHGLRATLRSKGFDAPSAEAVCHSATRLLAAQPGEIQSILHGVGIQKMGQRLKVMLAVKAACRVVAKPEAVVGESLKRARFRQVLRGERSALDIPRVHTKSGSAAPDRLAVAHVHEALLQRSGEPAAQAEESTRSLYHLVTGVTVNGKPEIGINTNGDPILQRWTNALFECGDGECTCNRLKHTARSELTERIVRTVSAAAARSRSNVTHPIRYLSVGCGHLLYDFGLLCALCRRIPAARIESITLVDPCYSGSVASANAALEQLAAFFAPCEVHSFEQLEAVRAAATHEPESFGRYNLIVQCDATDVPPESLESTAKACAQPGGHVFRLHNSRPFAHAEAWCLRSGTLMALSEGTNGYSLAEWLPSA